MHSNDNSRFGLEYLLFCIQTNCARGFTRIWLPRNQTSSAQTPLSKLIKVSLFQGSTLNQPENLPRVPNIIRAGHTGLREAGGRNPVEDVARHHPGEHVDWG